MPGVAEIKPLATMALSRSPVTTPFPAPVAQLMGFCHGFATVDTLLARFSRPGQFRKFRKCFRIERSSHAGRVAQLVRAPASHAGGRRFESCRAHHP